MGGTGNLPVPGGYQPTGTSASRVANRALTDEPTASSIPLGWQPSGTGRLPVPPQINQANISSP